ncbi:MAG: hypothetical protein Q9162_003120 [Coniocarpon cinnabarinum]
MSQQSPYRGPGQQEQPQPAFENSSALQQFYHGKQQEMARQHQEQARKERQPPQQPPQQPPTDSGVHHETESPGDQTQYQHHFKMAASLYEKWDKARLSKDQRGQEEALSERT